MKTKVIYLITKSSWGGASRYVFDLATNLPKDRFEVSVAAGRASEGAMGIGTLERKLDETGIPFIPLSRASRNISFFREWLLAYDLYKIFRKEKPDVVHVNSSKLGGVGAFAARIARVPKIIFTAHGWPFNERHLSPLFRHFIHFLSWLTSFFAHTTITITDGNFAQGKKFPGLARKMVKIPLGIKSEQFLSKDEARAKLVEIARSHNQELNQDSFWIGTIGELTHNKGHRYLLDAVSKIKGDYPDVQFPIISDGELRVALENQRTRLNLTSQVSFLGFVPNAKEYLKAFDIFILPSLKEGLPYTLLEAAAAGLPVIASNVGGIPDLLGNDGKSGILVEPESAESIAAAIKEALGNRERLSEMAESYSQKVSTGFSFEAMLSGTIALYVD